MGMESKIDTSTWGVGVLAITSADEGIPEQKQLPPPSVAVATSTPAAHTASSSSKSKFSMLFAAADNVLPSSLTASMMTVVGAVGIGRDRSSSGSSSSSSTKPPSSASSGTVTSPMPLLSPGIGVGVGVTYNSPLRGDSGGAGIAATGYPPSVGNGGQGQGQGQGHYNDMFSREMADSLAKKLSCMFTSIMSFIHVH